MYIRRFLSIAAAALSIAVCVFITYISRDTGAATIYFNLGFLAVMLCMVCVAYLSGVLRLIRASRALQRGADAVRAGTPQPQEPLFQYEFLDDCYQQYKQMVSSHPDGVCDIQNYINEEAVETHVHRGILESVPDILTSLGILGTFVGLVMGLREFNPSSYELMAGSVSPLINGIKVAFITSIYGIALSLSFSFSLRSEFSELSAKMDEFLDAYYLHVRPPYEVASLSRLVSHQKDQEEIVHDLTSIFVEQMGKSFEQSITPAFNLMSDRFRQITEAMLQNQEALLTQVCESVTRQMRAELAGDFDQIHKSVEQLCNAQSGYTDYIDHSMMSMQRILGNLESSAKLAQDHLAESARQTQDAVRTSLGQTKEYFTDSIRSLSAAQEEAYRINQEQKDAYQEYIRFMYQCIQRFSEIWDRNSEQLQTLSDGMAGMTPVQSSLEIQNQLAALTEQLERMQRQLSSLALSESNDRSSIRQEELHEELMQKLGELTDQLDRPLLFGRGKKRRQ